MPKQIAPTRVRRSQIRLICRIGCYAEFDTGARLRCNTVDISMAGARLTFQEDLRNRAGHSLERLDIPGAGVFQVSLRWSKGMDAGVAFTGAEAELDHLSAMLKHLETMRRKAQGP